ncbi:MAG: PAS domain-containing protein [Chloroflexota bacterium]|nr:PAS domain-containing protein [Chloroflexota bacterium]MDE3102381.1 PAS domain-containing protein [Chloroflexota bacterium]
MPLVPRSIGGRVTAAAVVALAIEVLASAGLAAVIVTGRSEGGVVPLAAARAALVTAVVLGGVIAAIAGIALASLAARSIGIPLRRLTDRARAGSVTVTGWSPGGGPRELSDLATAMRGFAAAAAERQTAAESERDRFATLLHEMGDAVLIAAPDDRIDLANPAAERLLGSAGVTGRYLAEVARDHELLTAVEEARRSGSAGAQIDRSEPRRSVRVVARLLPGGDVLVTAQDLTSMRRLETVRSDFVANVSHELRTPIASIKAMVETLESGGLRDERAAPDFLARIHREVDDLAQIVTELLSLTRIESGAEPLDLAATDPAELLRSAADRMRALARRGGVTLSVAPLPALPRVSVDREKIATVFADLIHNAVKFTPPGGSIVLGASRANGHVSFAVRDTGSGIARSDLERIFERFYKADASRSREGTGLGLAIAKHIVLAHGGQIHAESEGPGRGSTFRFTVPIAPAP